MFAFSVFLLLLLLLLLASNVRSQTAVARFKAAEKAAAAAQLPAWQGYKGVKIGTPAAEVKEKLGVPASEDKELLFYAVAENETAQIILDAAQKVRLITVMYSSGNPNAPKFENVFSKEMMPEVKPDGSIYKMVRYQEAGFWVSYSRLAGDNAMVTVTIQKL